MLRTAVDAGGPYTAETNETITFDSSGCYDPDGEIDFYRWNFGDGTSEILQKYPKHNFSQDGLYYVTLTVVDDNGSSSSSVTTVEVGDVPNYPPDAEISIPSTGYTGEQTSLTSTSTDPDGDELTCSWNVDNNNLTGSQASYQFNSPGNYVVTLTVSDGEFEDTATESITIEKKEEETPGFEIIIV
ncbi:MAG: PKD domain-containing protein, partial [Candidatus Aminicenantes bacterium]